MNDKNTDKRFWDLLDRMVGEHEIVIDRPRGSRHPRYESYVYPLDYGYLDKTASSDGAGVDVWIGTCKEKKVTGIISSVDIIKGDVEVKILYACTDEEMHLIQRDHNRTEFTVGVLYPREE